MAQSPPVIVKVGGSVLDRPDLAARLRGLVDSFLPSAVGLVVGGGAAADVVRAWDSRYRLGDGISHWLAIRAMGLNECLVEALLPGVTRVESLAAARAAWSRGASVIVGMEPLLREAAAQELAIPAESWSVTSDSLAAWMAGRAGVRELVLVKSCSPRGPQMEWREDGLTAVVWPPRRKRAGSMGRLKSIRAVFL